MTDKSVIFAKVLDVDRAKESSDHKELIDLAESEDEEVRLEVAGNYDTPQHVLEKLAFDDDPGVRAEAAFSWKLPVELLVWLAHDEDPNVRDRVASNPSLPDYVLTKLAKDEEWGVRWEAINNANAPLEALKLIVSDTKETDPELARFAKEQPKWVAYEKSLQKLADTIDEELESDST